MLSMFHIHTFYNLTWVPITLIGMIHSDKKEWSHTAHTRKINMSEILSNQNTSEKTAI